MFHYSSTIHLPLGLNQEDCLLRGRREGLYVPESKFGGWTKSFPTSHSEDDYDLGSQEDVSYGCWGAWGQVWVGCLSLGEKGIQTIQQKGGSGEWRLCYKPQTLLGRIETLWWFGLGLPFLIYHLRELWTAGARKLSTAAHQKRGLSMCLLLTLLSWPGNGRGGRNPKTLNIQLPPKRLS